MLGGDNGILSVVALVEGFEHGGIEGEMYLCVGGGFLCHAHIDVGFRFFTDFAYYYFRSR